MSKQLGIALIGLVIIVMEKGDASRWHGGPLFAIIPTLGVGGPLAVLAVLFPSLFGGVLLLFRQWGAFFTVISVNSLLYYLHWLFANQLLDSWWGTQPALWLTITAVTLLGLLWAWRRQWTWANDRLTGNESPARTEHIVLWLLSLSCTGLVVYYLVARPPSLTTMWALVFVLSAGLWLGTFYKLYRAVRRRWSGQTTSDLPTESVMLWTMLAGCILYVSWQSAPQGDSTEFTASEASKRPVAKRTGKWEEKLVIPGFGDSGKPLSSPIVVGDDIFIAVAFEQPIQMGMLFCVDKSSKKINWQFDALGQMKPVFSSPRIAEDRLYIGEGFHFDPNCSLYCVDVKSGEMKWAFPTGSQTEASPCIAEGMVVFGAGNDGLYAVDSKTGDEKWKYSQAAPIWRVGANPVVAKGRVYAGSGVDRIQPHLCETSLVCLDAANGKKIWKVKTDLPCWAEPVVAGDRVFFALGNGDIYFDDEVAPAGAVLCLDRKTGRKIWRFDAPNGILNKPAVDSQSIYVGCRDGHCYCVNRFSGKPQWRKFLGSAIVSAPVLDQGWLAGSSLNVFVITTRGRVNCLDAATGKTHWSYHGLEQREAYVCSTPALVVTPVEEGIRRHLYFGASLNNIPYLYNVEDLLPHRTK